jgi:hypothetical protein
MKKFKVHAANFNADTFRNNYQKYIIDEYDACFEDTIFELNAPQEIYDEISGLEEESITILKN